MFGEVKKWTKKFNLDWNLAMSSLHTQYIQMTCRFNIKKSTNNFNIYISFSSGLPCIFKIYTIIIAINDFCIIPIFLRTMLNILFFGDHDTEKKK